LAWLERIKNQALDRGSSFLTDKKARAVKATNRAIGKHMMSEIKTNLSAKKLQSYNQTPTKATTGPLNLQQTRHNQILGIRPQQQSQ